VVICLERGADLHMAQLTPLPLTVSCFSEIQIGFIFLVPAYPGSPGQRVVKRVCVCVILSTRLAGAATSAGCRLLLQTERCALCAGHVSAKTTKPPVSRFGAWTRVGLWNRV